MREARVQASSYMYKGLPTTTLFSWDTIDIFMQHDVQELSRVVSLIYLAYLYMYMNSARNWGCTTLHVQCIYMCTYMYMYMYIMYTHYVCVV